MVDFIAACISALSASESPLAAAAPVSWKFTHSSAMERATSFSSGAWELPRMSARRVVDSCCPPAVAATSGLDAPQATAKAMTASRGTR